MSSTGDKDRQLEISFGEAPPGGSGAKPKIRRRAVKPGARAAAPEKAPDAGGGAPENGAAGPAPAADGTAPPESGALGRLFDVNFLQYAAYVIRERAIPELNDGLKPVQRRILYALHEKDDGKFIKVANIVGHAMQYHPHGDASIGDALVALTNRGYLIEGQGNFGNIHTGDGAAAPRYIECRLTELARAELFNDNLTEFTSTYDGRGREPVTLPAKLPLLLMLGAEGIAVGLATRIPPHNFGELIAAQIAILKRKPFALLPDFPQGGLMDAGDYDDGRGRVRLRAVIESRDAGALAIRELPFGTTTESLIASIEDAARKKKIKIRAIQDYTAENVEIVIMLAPGETADRTVKALYAFTSCETAFSANGIVIRDRRPSEMSVSDILRANTAQLVELLRRELEHSRERLLERLHAKTLERIFIENRIYKRIEKCATQEAVNRTVFEGVNAFREELRRDITAEDVGRLLELHIRRISLYDIERNRTETAEIRANLADTEKSLKNLTSYAVAYLKRLLKTEAAKIPRRTRVTAFESVDTRALTASELTVRYDKASGYLGWAVEGAECLKCSSYDKLILAWDDGRYKVQAPPEKLFVDKNLLYCARHDRDRVITAVYTAGPASFLKRFTFGGAILNREYLFTPPKARVHLLTDTDPGNIFVVFAPAKNQRIHQQLFAPRAIPVKGVKARGNQMTVKKIRTVSVSKPRNWNEDGNAPPGRLLD